MECDAAGVARERELVVGQAVDVYWRRVRSWLASTLRRAVITRVNLDGAVAVRQQVEGNEV